MQAVGTYSAFYGVTGGVGLSLREHWKVEDTIGPLSVQPLHIAYKDKNTRRDQKASGI